MWHDRPMSAIDTAIYWTEFVGRHKNFTFNTAAAYVPMYQYLGLDILIVIITLLGLVFYSIKITIAAFCKSKTIKVTLKQKSKRKTN